MCAKKITLIRVLVIALALFCVGVAVLILVTNPLENDLYKGLGHNKEFFHCPTCGLTRAIYCLLTLRLKDAFYYHAFFTVTFPFLAYLVLTLFVNLFFAKKILPYPKKYSIYLYTYFALFMLFSIVRNFTTIIY